MQVKKERDIDLKGKSIAKPSMLIETFHINYFSTLS